MIASTRDIAVLALALFLSFSVVDAFGGGGPKGLAKKGSAETSIALPDHFAASGPPHVHHRGNPRTRRFYINHDVTSDESPKRAVRRRHQGSRVSKKKEVVRPVDTLGDFESEVLGEKERMVVVRFHAPWCKVRKRNAFCEIACNLQKYPQF
uniref:Thioredoxin domain-containing protein n=1 Tax=Odontella aurita TaxID=265563 RepID=A0A7S4MFU6_9STRA|mmetsp:Transcript_20367/g.58906  ORF Transcript_20367/g.58906 Transcript_20367/m.58906 type:complete len:152 (+) Transcript_20367:360-815(+)